MVAYLEKTDGNTEFHEIIDFLSRSSIHYALTVSPVVSTTFIEQFWMSAKSKIIDNIRNITAKVAGKPVTISEASIRSSLLFDDADGIDSLNNQAIFDAIQQMGYEGDLTKGKHFSGKVTPLFPTMLVQPTEDEGEGLNRPSAPQPTPSPPHTNQHEPMPDPTPRPIPTIPDSIPQGAGGNLGDQSSNDRSLSGSEDGLTLQSLHDLCISLCKHVTGQAKEIKALKAQVKKLKRKAIPVINYHKAWLWATRLKKRRGVFKQRMKVVKSSKGEPSAHKDLAFDDDFEDLLDDAMDYQRTKDVKDKESTDLHQGTDTQKVSTDRVKESTDIEKVSTDNTKLSTDKVEEGTAELDDNEPKDSTTTTAQTPTPTTPTTTFRDDETIAKVLLNMSQAKAILREKEKGVELKDVENTERPRPTSTRYVLTLKPLPKIDPKDKGKKRIEEEESDTTSDDINETEKKFKMLAHDEEIARKMQEDWEAEEEKIKGDRLLALRLQDKEREQFTMEERAKFLHDTIAAQRRFLAQQQSEAIRNKPSTRTQLRNQMMTYLKHIGNKQHSDLKNKTFEEIQVLYDKIKRYNDKFLDVGSTEDERKIKEMNDKAKDPRQKRLKKRVVKETPKEKDTAKVLAEHEVTEQGTKKRKSGHIKMIARKRPRQQP
ncbi:hypothetical protein Tco_1099889, partial [Tanacetum coccineum]